MRILHVSPTYLPATRYGGPIYAVHGLARAQAARGDDVHVFATNVDGGGVTPTPLGSPVDIDGVQVWYFPCGLGRRIFRAPRMADELNACVRDFDVVHAHSAFLWPASAAARAARRENKPFLFSPRGMLTPELVCARSRFAKSLWINVIGKDLMSRASAIHVTSDVERDGVERLRLKAQMFGVVPNGVDPPPHLPPLDVSRPFVLSLGRISWKKGLDRLIEAFAYVSDADLVIAGNDEERLTPRLKALAGRLGLSARVRFVGPVAGDAKWRLLRAASAFALASHSENFANAVLEAMICGVPVVVTPQVGLAATVESNGAGLVVDRDPAIFGAAIASLLADAGKRAAMGAAAEAVARQSFSWPAIASAMDELYQRARVS